MQSCFQVWLHRWCTSCLVNFIEIKRKIHSQSFFTFCIYLTFWRKGGKPPKINTKNINTLNIKNFEWRRKVCTFTIQQHSWKIVVYAYVESKPLQHNMLFKHAFTRSWLTFYILYDLHSIFCIVLYLYCTASLLVTY